MAIKSKFYIYAHLDRETGEIVYVGKGTRERALYSYHRDSEHEQFMLEQQEKGDPLSGWFKCLAYGLTAKEAFAQEAALIAQMQPRFNKAGK